MKLVFATHNKNKLQEVQALFPKDITLLSLDDIGCFEEIPETADTIDGNAILKANFVKEHYHMDCFADDTGLEVKALNGEPGVHSARYAGTHKDNEANIDKLLANLENRENREARFKTVIALNLEGHELLFTGVCEGTILKERKGEHGFGYDAVFQPNNSEKSFGEMEMEEKSKHSHRGKALRNLIEYLAK
ncbi:XTP/dITP diphosphohydrolase [Gillisia sp. Hel_I_86]|uniref:non-canonical purine NTP diphosphatase n=1 Tax=Gillisia sp. Hel_I_86 TaxID=1249981 RepID=UPI0011990135|nr:non-canonical purine NTP diphosphatase [Gillisia sp. Hel_I_86]TVZ28150.1 XTP/dITP diphosphohydrolase [Gillisia sp. Hel_I_86]